MDIKNKLNIHAAGATPYETILVLVCCLLHSKLTILLSSQWKIYNYSRIYVFLIEFCCYVIPSVLSLTLLAQYNSKIVIFQLPFVLILIMRNLKRSEYRQNLHPLNTIFITDFRAMCNILSVIAILAVDFEIFPRRFAKTEMFGYSLMDTGVGLFVFANGIVSPEARNRKDSISKSVIGSIPLLLLGFSRFILTKQTDYKVAVSEYGIHWNFFITLAIIKILSSLVLNVISIQYIYINASLLIASHEIFLQSGISQFVFRNTVRDTFLKANKEGLASVLGYVSLYLFSVYFGHLLHTVSKEGNIRIIMKFVHNSLIFLILTVLFENYFGISRRLANGAYCFWILFIAISFLGCLFVFQEFCTNHNTLFINEAVNYNGLTFFLIGNILTGLVNLSMKTSDIMSISSVSILVLYMLINCSVICILYYKKIKLKM